MFKPLEAFVGLRYTRAKRRNHFISFISLISLLGIVVGVMALITVLSVMNGFQQEVRERILSMVAHATITGVQAPLRDWRQVADAARQDRRVTGVAPYVRTEVMMTHGQNVSGALVRGIVPEAERGVSEVGDHMVAGGLEALRPGAFNVVLGHQLAFALGVDVGDKLRVITPQATVTPAGILPRLKRFTVVGTFEVDMFEYDRTLALVHMEDAARLLRLENGVTGVRLKLDDLFRAPAVARELARRLPGGHSVTDWTRQHANFFRAVQIEKTAMFVILLLIVGVAAFNIVSTLVMVVQDKQADIAILRTLGATPATIMGVFIIQGTVIGFAGTLVGAAGGVALALNVETLVPAIERLFNVQFLAADVYFISELPSDMHWSDVLTICGAAFGLSVLATLYPAWRASRTEPAEALRYE